METVQTITERVINKFVVDFCSNPMNFLYESDIQGILFATLYDALSADYFKIQLNPVKFADHFNKQQQINPVKTEYPYKKRIDIGIIDNNEKIYNDYDILFKELKNIFPDLNSDIFWHLPLSIGIEIKYCQLGEGIGNKFGEMKGDLLKLENYRNSYKNFINDFCGLGILFVQYNKFTYYDNPTTIEKLINATIIPDEKQIKIEPGITGWIVVAGGESGIGSIYRYNYSDSNK